MEAVGQVNYYAPYKREGVGHYTINLANGTTPFMLVLDGKEFASCVYSLTHLLTRTVNQVRINVKHAWYRPAKEEFLAMSEDIQDHILNGGLNHKPIGEAVQLPNDPVLASWDYETFQEWCLRYYGKRRPPMEKNQ